MLCDAEKDVNGDVLWTWGFPGLSAEHKAVIDRKTGLWRVTSFHTLIMNE